MGVDAVVWVCLGLGVVGVALVLAAVLPLTRRARPMRRVLRRLARRQEELERIRARVDHLQVRLLTLSEQAQRLAAQRATAAATDGDP
jgi:Flp pilus assembly protein TadB